MGYRLDHDDPTVEEAVRRIAVERIDDAVAAIDDPGVTRAKAVHTVRKRCKELRALVRLVGPVFAHSKRENRAFRDIARGLSGQRDATVMAETFEGLVKGRTEQLDQATLSAARALLAEDAGPADAGEEAEAIARARESLAAARLRALEWSLDAKGWRAFGEGLGTTYAKARKRMGPALASEDGEPMHEWRKEAKYHYNQMRVMRPLWAEVLKPVSGVADELGEALGAHHDLEVLAALIGKNRERLGGEAAISPLLALCRAEQARHAATARAAGERLFAEKPKAFCRRMRSYWSVWRRETPGEADGTASAPAKEAAAA